MRVNVLCWDSGDWVAIEVDGRLYREGHSISDYDWMELLKRMGAHVTREEIQYDEVTGEGPTRYSELLPAERQVPTSAEDAT